MVSKKSIRKKCAQQHGEEFRPIIACLSAASLRFSGTQADVLFIFGVAFRETWRIPSIAFRYPSDEPGGSSQRVQQ